MLFNNKLEINQLDTIDSTICKKTKLNQWYSFSSVITWFSNIPKKNECKFSKFDVVNFYPSIMEELLTASIDFAREHMEISDETIYIIMQARKSLLFNPQGETWTKNAVAALMLAWALLTATKFASLSGYSSCINSLR